MSNIFSTFARYLSTTVFHANPTAATSTQITADTGTAKALEICGGSSNSEASGASIAVMGNTWGGGGTAGAVNITGGAVTGGGLQCRIAGSSNVMLLAQTAGGNAKLSYATTVTSAGTTGAQTINKISGTVNFAAAATSLVVTNELCTASSIVFATVRTNDATAQIKNVVPGAGSFTITLSAAATAETSVGFFIIN